MDKEVAKWLHQQLGCNAAADSTLSANCRGNLKSLWEFLMANYKTPENKKHMQNVLEKHRREQEIARLAPELRQQALKEKQRLKQLDERAVALQRTLASLQAAIENSTQDAAEQYGEQGLFKQELREAQTQAMMLQSANERVQQLLPLLQAKLCKLQSDAELAKARCHASGGSRRLQHVSLQLQDLSSTIREELMQVLDRKLTQQQQLQQQHSTMAIAASDQHDSQHGLDQQLASTLPSSSPSNGKKHAGSITQHDTSGALAPQSSSLWKDLNIGSGSLAASPAASGDLSLGRCSLVTGYSPSQGVRASALQLLQEAPELLLMGSCQLASHSSHELCAILNEAETALLAPVAWGAAGQENVSSSVNQSMQQLQGLLRNAANAEPQADSCPYTLPWTIPWQSSLAAAAAGGGQQDREFQSPEALVKQRQQMHVQLFVQAKAAKTAAAAADKELTRMLGSTPLLRQGIGGFDGNGNSSTWEAQLAGLWLRAEGLKAEVQLLQQRKVEFEQDVDGCLQSEQQLQEKWASIEAAVADDQELNGLLWQVAADNMELYAALCSQQEQVLGLLRSQLAPCGAAASNCAISGRDGFVNELGVVGKLPLAGVLPAQRIAADTQEGGKQQAAGATSLSTLVRLQLGAQRLSQLGRPTTAPKAFATAARIGAPVTAGGQAVDATSSSGAGVDTAAVSALRAAAAVDAMAAARCPAALLLHVADEYQQVRQLQQQLEQLNMLCRGATTSAQQATEQAERLQQQDDVHAQLQQEELPWMQTMPEVDDLRAKDQQEVLPWLQDKLEAVQQQRMFAKQEVAVDVSHSSEMPAQHLLPNRKYEGWSCSEWLAQIQALHGKKRELKTAATKAHH